MRRKRLHARGLSMLEILVTVALLALIAGLAFPPLQRTMYRTRVMGQIRTASNMLQVARLEAIRRGFPAVVRILPATNEMVAFVDIHGVAQTDPPDGLYSAIGGATYRETDYEIGRVTLGAGLTFEEPGGNTGLASVDGFNNPAPLPDQVAIFQVDGSVQAAGAFRFVDRRANYLESRIAPAATGKVQIRKWDASLNVNWDGTHWYALGEVSRAWEWN